MFIKPDESVRGSDAFVIQSFTTPINHWMMESADPGRRAQARVGQADHRRRAVLPVRPAGQEAPRPRADLGPADGRPVQDRRRRPADGRSTCTPRRSRASSTARSTTCSRCRCSPTTSRSSYRGRGLHRRLARHRPGADGRAVGRPARRQPDRVRAQDARPARAQPGRRQPGRR